MVRITRRLLVGAVVAVPTVLGVSVGYATAAPTPNVRFGVVHAINGTIGPNSNLKLKNSALKFAPSQFNLTETSGKKCKTTNYEFSITNKSGSSQSIDLNGSPWQTLASGSETFVCSGPGEIQFTVPGTPATLTVNTSDGS